MPEQVHARAHSSPEVIDEDGLSPGVLREPATFGALPTNRIDAGRSTSAAAVAYPHHPHVGLRERRTTTLGRVMPGHPGPADDAGMSDSRYEIDDSTKGTVADLTATFAGVLLIVNRAAGRPPGRVRDRGRSAA